MADNIISTYPVDFERTATAVGYGNDSCIADMVQPRVDVGRKEYRYTEYPLAESFSVPETRVGRRGTPVMVHFSAEEKSGACQDYSLEDLIPDDDVRNAPPTTVDPIDRSTMMLTDLLMIDREKRVADDGRGSAGGENCCWPSLDQCGPPRSGGKPETRVGQERTLLPCRSQCSAQWPAHIGDHSLLSWARGVFRL